jgi:hypothetical protein
MINPSADHRSVYRAGAEAPTFTVGNVTFGALSGSETVVEARTCDIATDEGSAPPAH